MNDLTKVCSKCKKRKYANEFTKDKHQKSGLACRCKECIKKYANPNVYSRSLEYINARIKKAQANPNYKKKHAEYQRRYLIKKLSKHVTI